MSGNHSNSTRALHAGSQAKHWTHSPLVAPIYLSTTFETLDPGQADYEYSRCDNPTRTETQSFLAQLESAKFALAFSSGLGALTVSSFLLKPGDHILCSDDVYGGTNRFFNHCAPLMARETTFVQGTSVSSWTDNFIVGKTKMVWIESPTNPTLKIVDIESISREIKKLDQECIVIVDNTFMTPIFQSPLNLGADVVMHSCTKYISGHSDLIMGALMTNNEKIYSRLKYLQNALGIIPSPFDCSQLNRSIKTLNIRVRRQAESAMEVAQYLEREDCVDKVLYPGLKSHPQHELATRQFSGFGGMITFHVKTVKGDEGIKIVQAVKVFLTAVSLGCVCSLIEIPSLMTHSAVPESQLENLSIDNNLLRLSIGLEDPKDLIGDLKQAIEAAYQN